MVYIPFITPVKAARDRCIFLDCRDLLEPVGEYSPPPAFKTALLQPTRESMLYRKGSTFLVPFTALRGRFHDTVPVARHVGNVRSHVDGTIVLWNGGKVYKVFNTDSHSHSGTRLTVIKLEFKHRFGSDLPFLMLPVRVKD